MSTFDHIKFEESIAYSMLKVENSYSHHHAIVIGNEIYSYQRLFGLAKGLSFNLINSKETLCLILSRRNIMAYVGLLGSLFSGKAYLFLNEKDPISKIKKIIVSSKTRLLIFDDFYSSLVSTINSYFHNKLTTMVLESKEEMIKNSFFYIPPKTSYEYAYMMFTSGSTGEPKGVFISHKNLKKFCDNIIRRINPNAFDRFSHINELTFDFSVYDIFCCWISGACLCVLTNNYIYCIDKYIENHGITYWASVPSVIQWLKNIKKLKKSSFQTIRYSVFCGEILTQTLAKSWKLAATNTIIDNLYGPTETTVAITGYLWNEMDTEEIVPIGRPFPGQGFYLVSELGEVVEPGKIGEIYLYGDQVAKKYSYNSKKIQSSFREFNNRFIYKTGDLALLDPEKGLIFKGRKDDQLKLNGYRIEKVEIENDIKKILKTQSIAIVALKNHITDQVEFLACFFSGINYSAIYVKRECQKKMNNFMMPHQFIKLKQLPRNENGKIDYRALMLYLKK